MAALTAGEHPLFSVRRRAGVLGALLAGCVLLPVDPDTGLSVFDFLIRMLRDDLVSGLLLTLTLGLPYVFGVLVAMHGLGSGRFGAWGIRSANDLLVVEVFLLGLNLANGGRGIAPYALLGVSGSAMLARLGEFFASRVRPTPPMFFIRWGALLIAATFAWFRVQFIGGDVRPGIAITATAVCAALLAATAAVPRAQPTA